MQSRLGGKLSGDWGLHFNPAKAVNSFLFNEGQETESNTGKNGAGKITGRF